MAQPSPELVELAQRIVESEDGDLSDPAAATEAACRRLTEHLVDMLGSGGVSALLGRALHLAQRERPQLAGVTVSGDLSTCFTGLGESLAASSEEEAGAAAATVLAHVLNLLVMLLGDELGMQPVRKLWPHAIGDGENNE